MQAPESFIFRTGFCLALCLAWLALPQGASASGDDHEDEHEAPAHVRIDPAVAESAGIRHLKAGPGRIERTLTSYGRLEAHPDRIARVSARFPGLVQSIDAGLGDRVEPGAGLATIEADQSLNSYRLRTPIAGTVIERAINLGEYARNEPLFTIADLGVVRVELKVFPGQLPQVAPGQPVRLRLGDDPDKGSTVSRIDLLLPGGDDAPFVHALVDVDNSAGTLVLGQLVAADIVVESAEVPLAVPLGALQTLEGETVVFVREGAEYEPRPVTLGRRDGQWAEVLDGLSPGEQYVSENSYLILADLGKAGASHAH